jgi:hypothetical protein
MGIDVAIGLVFGIHVTQQQHQSDVLENVCMVARMKGVAVGEHGERRNPEKRGHPQTEQQVATAE